MILISSLLRIWVAASLELGNDEVYYQTYARHLQWNYFDHPPMVALLIRLSTFNLYFHNELFSRLGSICCAAAGTWLIFKTGNLIRNERTGWIAALLYNTSFYSSIIAGTFILPDSPQVLCWLFSIYFMIVILKHNKDGKLPVTPFILLGISIGLCIMSKVHGIFLWIGFVGYIIFLRKDLLKSPALWFSAFVSLIIVFPIYWWNLENHFITYQYHQGRISFWGKYPDPDRLLQQLLGSVFYSNPVNFILYIVALWGLYRSKTKSLPGEYLLLLWLSLPLIGVLLWTSLFNDTLPHWSGPAYLSLLLLASCWLDEKEDRIQSLWLKTTAWFFGSVVILGVISILYLPFRIGQGAPSRRGQGDITLDMTGWRGFSGKFDSLYRTDIISQRMKPGAIILCDYWFPAGHMDYYYATPYHHYLIAIGPVRDIHHFAWKNQRGPRLNSGSDAYFIYPSNYYGPPKASLKDKFQEVEDSILIPQYRSGNLVRYFVIYRLHYFRGDSLDYLYPGIR